MQTGSEFMAPPSCLVTTLHRGRENIHRQPKTELPLYFTELLWHAHECLFSGVLKLLPLDNKTIFSTFDFLISPFFLLFIFVSHLNTTLSRFKTNFGRSNLETKIKFWNIFLNENLFNWKLLSNNYILIPNLYSAILSSIKNGKYKSDVEFPLQMLSTVAPLRQRKLLGVCGWLKVILCHSSLERPWALWLAQSHSSTPQPTMLTAILYRCTELSYSYFT